MPNTSSKAHGEANNTCIPKNTICSLHTALIQAIYNAGSVSKKDAGCGRAGTCTHGRAGTCTHGRAGVCCGTQGLGAGAQTCSHAQGSLSSRLDLCATPHASIKAIRTQPVNMHHAMLFPSLMCTCPSKCGVPDQVAPAPAPMMDPAPAPAPALPLPMLDFTATVLGLPDDAVNITYAPPELSALSPTVNPMSLPNITYFDLSAGTALPTLRSQYSYAQVRLPIPQNIRKPAVILLRR